MSERDAHLDDLIEWKTPHEQPFEICIVHQTYNGLPLYSWCQVQKFGLGTYRVTMETLDGFVIKTNRNTERSIKKGNPCLQVIVFY